MTDISEEYKQMLRQLHDTTHPERQPGEFTIPEYAGANGMTVRQATAELAEMHRSGKIEKPSKKYIGSRMMVVYKMIAEDRQK